MNKFICNGNLTRDPEIKFTQNTNTKVASISVAVRRSYKNAQGEYDSDFFNFSAFGNQAEFLEKYFKKGQGILISAHAQQRKWVTDGGENRYATDFVIETIDFMGQKSSNNDNETATVEVNVSNEAGDDLPF